MSKIIKKIFRYLAIMKSNPIQSEVMKMQKHNSTVEKAKIFIKERIDEVTPESVSAYSNYSSRQLSRIFEMVTGATLGEYLRWSRLSRAMYEIKYSDAQILDIAIKYQYESQEAFTRIFRSVFGITPGECRKSDACITIKKNTHLQKLIEEVSHEAADQGFYKVRDVDVWHIVKPARIWISSQLNDDEKPPHMFFDHCEENGNMARAWALPNTVSVCGAYLTMAFPEGGYKCLSWGAEVEPDYDIDELKGFEVFRIPESKYVVFSAPNFSPQNHGETIKSTWDIAHSYQYDAYNLDMNTDTAPIYEDVNDDFGYSVWFPVKDKKPAQKGEVQNGF